MQNDKYNKILEGQNIPSTEQIAWVVAHLHDHFREGGTYRYLIYYRWKQDPSAYATLQVAGALDLSNIAYTIKENNDLFEGDLRGEPQAMSDIDFAAGLERLADLASRNKPRGDE
jgi:hypothetical protein